MTITVFTADFITRMSLRNSLKGRICHYGSLASISDDITYGFVREIFDEVGKPFPEGEEMDSQPIGEVSKFLRVIGYEDDESLDFGNVDGATHIFDLNSEECPKHLVDRFDVMYNNGTLEHIFHIPNCLANVTRMLKIGGYAFHICPVNNHVDHGFYQFSPGLMFDYYEENGFEIKDSVMIRYRLDPYEPYTVWGDQFYSPFKLPSPTYYDGKMDDAVYALLFVVRKTARSTTDRIPIQRMYRPKEENFEEMSSDQRLDTLMALKKDMLGELD